MATVSEMIKIMPIAMHIYVNNRCRLQIYAGSKYPKLINENANDDDVEEEEDEDEGDSAETGSTSSFSLQECINEFRARRIRRVSTHSRDREMVTAGEDQQAAPTAPVTVAADAHLINQNRCNKEQERKGKPCKNGFCYCFTSDSGDCASTAPPRDWHVRQHRRSRRSETNKVRLFYDPFNLYNINNANYHILCIVIQVVNNLNAQQSQKQGHNRRQSIPSDNKKPAAISSHTSVAAIPLTAVSSLRAVGDDAPLIHIIQELRDNCVISEVRVNKQKLPSARCSTSSSKSASLKQRKAIPNMQKTEHIEYKPTAPALSNISEHETPLEECDDFQTEATSLAGVSLQSARCKSRRSSSGGGRLLQKRLSSGGQVNFKPRDVEQPPPKPPRRSAQSLDGKTSLSSLTSTTASVRDAERILDEFLAKHGVQLPISKVDSSSKVKSKRKSFPLGK